MVLHEINNVHMTSFLVLFKYEKKCTALKTLIFHITFLLGEHNA